MSLDQRLRDGLSAITEHLQPNLDRELAALLRRARRRRRVRTAGLALAAAVAAVVAISLPGGPDSILGNDDSAPVDRPSPDPTTGVPRWVVEGHLPVLQPGRHEFKFYTAKAANVPSGLADLRAVIDMPAGFLGWGKTQVEPWEASSFRPGARPNDDEDRGIEFATVDLVNAEFCGNMYQDPGPTVADLATALAHLPPYRSTDPVPTSLGGYDGLYLEVSWPDDVRSCDQRAEAHGAAGLMGGYAGTDMALAGPGKAYRLWILDVEGERVVIAVDHRTDDPAEDIAELTRVVESTTFTTIEGSDP